LSDASYEVHTYSIDCLKDVFAKASLASKEYINGNLHTLYFEGYCSDIGASTVVVESEYIDQHYLEDFAEYYARCFYTYKRKCTRVHLFKSTFVADDLAKLLAGEQAKISQESLQESYLGFVVVQPLPETIIGRTCLRTYDDDNNRRHFPITRKYAVNLFGIKLSVKTLAYQEQDRAVAVCATSALWSVFQGTGVLWHHPIPSPIEITKTATSQSSPESRTLLQNGLNPQQLANGIRSVGLEPYIINANVDYVLKTSIYAYLSMGIPVILGFQLIDTTCNPNKLMGRHAVAVTGFSTGLTAPTPLQQNGFVNRATQIDKIYVHDDQIGPFARMEFDGNDVNVLVNTAPPQVQQSWSLSTSWKGNNGEGPVGSARCVPEILIVPLYHKIRIPYEDIHNTVMRFDGLIWGLIQRGHLPIQERLEWEINLTTVNQLKADNFNSADLDADQRTAMLTSSMPKFIWKATGYSGGNLILTFLFDATDMAQGPYFIRALEYDSAVSAILRAVVKTPQVEKNFQGKPEWKIIEWFRNT